MKNKKLITEEDVQNALHKFVKDGGLIKHLPDQVTPGNPPTIRVICSEGASGTRKCRHSPQMGLSPAGFNPATTGEVSRIVQGR